MQQDNATQAGAESLQPAHSGRNAALAQIASAVNASYQEDMAGFDETTGQILPKQAEKPPVQQPAQETQAAAEEGEQEEEQQEPQEAATQTAAKPEEELETIVVDGQQVQVKRSQLIDAGRRTLQKEEAAAKRLEEATATLRQAQAYAAQLRQQYQPSPDAGNDSLSPSSDATNRSGAQAIPVEDIRTLVRHEQWLANAETAAQRFKTEFKDIAEDPLLMRLAGQLEDERLAQAAQSGAPLGDPWEAYRKHGETIRARFLKTNQAVQPAVSEDRVERKRSTTTVVGAGARMQASQPKQPLTTTEIIEQQRIARRQGRQIPTAR